MLELISAESQHINVLFDWANDPDVRRMSFSPDPIEFEDHKKWFFDKLADKNTQIYIAIKERKPIGQIRFDNIGDTAEIDIHLTPEYRGIGLGAQIISKGVESFAMLHPDKNIRATVKTQNTKSQRAFTKAGFSELRKTGLCVIYSGRAQEI